MKQYLGYYEKSELPIKRGDRVRIPKGTIISTMYPKVDPKPAGKSYTIIVDHILSGSSRRVGYAFPDGRIDFYGLHRTDLYRIKDIYGTDDIESLWPFMYTKHGIGKVMDILLPVSNPSVRWPGRGGYWNEADINDVVLLTE